MTTKQTSPLSAAINLRLLATNDENNQAQQLQGAPVIIPHIATGVASGETWQWAIKDDIAVSTIFLSISAQTNNSSSINISIKNEVGNVTWNFTMLLSSMTKLGNLYYLSLPDGVYLRDSFQLLVTPNMAIDIIQFRASHAYLFNDIYASKV